MNKDEFLSVVKSSYDENSDIQSRKFENLEITDEVFAIVEFQNCEFQHCKIMTSKMEKLTFADCLFVNCDFSNTSFERASFVRCKFENCKGLGCNFVEARWYHNLSEAQFFKTKLNGMDFRTSNIEGILVSLESLKGAIVTDYQAVDLAKLIGIIIK